MASFVEYIWLDGCKPTQSLRSKTRIVATKEMTLADFPQWGYDGSSTEQASGDNSDLVLKPVNFCRDPLRPGQNYLVMCEVFDSDGEPHETNSRSDLRKALEPCQDKAEPWIGFEQEYVLLEKSRPLGWPENGYPQPQGPFYCGAGIENTRGREVVEAHAAACVDAGLCFYGLNAEVMLGQWEFQIGYRGIEGDNNDILNFSDHMWMARWLLHVVAEKHNVAVCFDNKPISGDWNGSGCHTNFSTRQTRSPKTGMEAINNAIKALSTCHREHIEAYGYGLSDRLTGLHETCSINEFKSGASNRSASIRIPLDVEKQGYGYFEDRRPGANCDPYRVACKLVSTVCNSKHVASSTEEAVASAV